MSYTVGNKRRDKMHDFTMILLGLLCVFTIAAVVSVGLEYLYDRM